jgi:hypothetical protein
MLGLVSKHHPVELVASRLSRVAGVGYQWNCSPYEFRTIRGKLEPLSVESARGHQYFELVQSEVKLIVSIGEYDGQWWQEHG